MRRSVFGFLVATACAVTLGSVGFAQTTTTSKTKIKAEHGKVVNYTGCVQTGTETRTYVLQNVVPISTTRSIGTSGVETTTTYALVPQGTVELQEQVGHKVEVSGILVPAGKGDTKYKARTKVNGQEEKTKGEFERGPMPQLKVVSVKRLAESC